MSEFLNRGGKKIGNAEGSEAERGKKYPMSAGLYDTRSRCLRNHVLTSAGIFSRISKGLRRIRCRIKGKTSWA